MESKCGNCSYNCEKNDNRKFAGPRISKEASRLPFWRCLRRCTRTSCRTSRPEKIKGKYGEKAILELPPDSPWTDDTQLMLVIARGLLRGAELELPELMGHIAEELVLWLDEPDMGAGATSRGAALKLREAFTGAIRDKV